MAKKDEPLKEQDTTTDEEQETEASDDENEGALAGAKANAERYKQQRDDANKHLKELEDQVAGLKGKDEEVEALKKQIEDEKTAYAEKEGKLEGARVNTARLAQAGCIDIEVALPLLNEHGDVEALKKSKPYLFQQTGSTGGKPAGVSADDDIEIKVREAAKALKPK